MSFDPSKFASQYITTEEVLEIKKSFDLFDRDLGGAIDPRCKKFPYIRIKGCNQCSRYGSKSSGSLSNDR